MNLVALWRGRRRCGSNASRSLAASGGCAPLPAMTGNPKPLGAKLPRRRHAGGAPPNQLHRRKRKPRRPWRRCPRPLQRPQPSWRRSPRRPWRTLRQQRRRVWRQCPLLTLKALGLIPHRPLVAPLQAVMGGGGRRSRQTYRGSSTATKAPTAPAPEAALDALQDPENKDHLEKVTRALKAIQDQWPGVQGELAFGIDENANAEEQGCRAIWDPEEFRIAVATPARAYECAGNLLHSNLVQQACKGVRINRSNVQRLQNAFFKDVESAAMPLTVVVAVESGVDPMTVKGELLCLSPLEVNHALVLRVGDAIAANEGDLAGWLRLLRTVPMRFQVVDSAADCHWEAVRLRERHSHLHMGVCRTPIQRVQEVVSLRKRLEETQGAVSAAQLAEFYKESVGGTASTTPTPGIIQ